MLNDDDRFQYLRRQITSDAVLCIASVLHLPIYVKSALLYGCEILLVRTYPLITSQRIIQYTCCESGDRIQYPTNGSTRDATATKRLSN